MEIPDSCIIESLYNSDIVTEYGTTEEYKKLMVQYNKLYDTVEDEELKEKFTKLQELKNAMHLEDNKQTFKIGYCLATRTLIESLMCKI